MTLYSYFRSSTSYRLRIALNFKNLAYEQVNINLVDAEQRSENYLCINAQGLVPSLKDGTFTLTQSLAIIDYLEEKYPTLPSLYPKAPELRAFTRQISHIISNDIHPINNLRVLKYIKDEFGISDQQKLQWYQGWIHKGFQAIESILKQSPYFTDTYCCGDTITLADICLIPQVYNARRFNCPLEDFPLISKIEQLCLQHDAFDKARPEKQPDTPDALRMV